MFHAFKKLKNKHYIPRRKNDLQLSPQGIQQVFCRNAATATVSQGPAGEATELGDGGLPALAVVGGAG